jgi:hypothetical protein
MTREDIVRMAREAGYPLDEAQSDFILRFQAVLADFAALVAAAERETIAKKFDGPVWSYDYREIAAAIRARGE